MGRTSTERDYLSIKEVLEVLVEEFPDVTISKIRFLESRGLIHPERTPSGYRKFFKNDVGRLRWILRQQRENFLPLKVIKGRLDREQGGTSEPSLFDSDLDGEELDRELADRAPRSVTSDLSESWTGESFPTESPSKSIAAPSLPRIVATGEDLNSETASPVGTIPAPTRSGMHTAFDEGATVAPSSTDLVDPGPSTVVEVVSSPPAPRASKSNAVVNHGSGGASLSASELCGATGSAPGLVEALEEFGLITARVVSGVRSYDEDALVIAHLASTFSHFGLEPRHLAVLRRAADRQAELYVQAIGPLLRQRNPESRAQAQEQLEQLVELGAALQAAFVKASVHRQIGS
ncbi:MAG TPA: MerR family transcriptional regulator [Acidimicrobiales bacterium]|nr:MerR family transcriptional regulator [Acidimicrobiales bacterium]